jgi:glutathione peroxidase-family protein
MKTSVFGLFFSVLMIQTLFGQIIPNFTLENVTLSNYAQKKAIVVVFTSSHCMFAKEYVGRLNQLNQQYSGQGVQFIAINSNDATLAPDDGAEKMRVISAYQFPYLKDNEQKVAKLFGAARTPEVFILQPQGGQFSVSFKGGIDDNPLDGSATKNKYLENAIGQILSTGKVGQPQAPNGSSCGMKWR